MAKGGKSSINPLVGLDLLIAANKQPTKEKIKQEVRAGINFPVNRIKTYMRKCGANKRLGSLSAVYLASVLEYLTAEIADMAGTVVLDEGKKTINQKHLFKAINGDLDLQKVFNGIIKDGGVKQTVTDFRFKTKEQQEKAEKMAKKDQKDTVATMGA